MKLLQMFSKADLYPSHFSFYWEFLLFHVHPVQHFLFFHSFKSLAAIYLPAHVPAANQASVTCVYVILSFRPTAAQPTISLSSPHPAGESTYLLSLLVSCLSGLIPLTMSNLQTLLCVVNLRKHSYSLSLNLS